MFQSYDPEVQEVIRAELASAQEQLDSMKKHFSAAKEIFFEQKAELQKENSNLSVEVQKVRKLLQLAIERLINFGQQLQERAEATNETARRNDAEIKRLSAIIEDLQKSPLLPDYTRAPLPVVTEGDIIELMLPLVRQHAREDMAEALQALHSGVSTAMKKYQDMLSQLVWARLTPVMQFAHTVRDTMEEQLKVSAATRAPGPGQASNSE